MANGEKTFDELAREAGLDPSSVGGDASAQVQPTSFDEAAVQAKLGASVDSLSEFADNLVNPVTGEMRPDYANGVSPETAINQSPLNPIERFKLKGLGNKDGIRKALEAKFEEVKETPQGLSVRKGGSWFRVDPNNLGDADAWEVTKGIFRAIGELGGGITTAITREEGSSLKTIQDRDPVAAEILSEIGENLPLAALVGGSIATGGSIPALGAVGAGVAGLQTSMGRLVGTYDDDPVDQVTDIAMEAAWNMAIPGLGKGAGALKGPIVKAGEKVSATKIGRKLIETAKAGGNQLSEGAKTAIANTYGRVTMGVEEMKRTLDRPGQVGKKLVEFDNLTKAKGGKKLDVIGETIVKKVRQIASMSNSALSKFYDDGMKEFERVMPSNFTWNPVEVMNPMFRELQKQGLGLVDKTGRFRMYNINQLSTNSAPTALIRELSGNPRAYGNLSRLITKLNKTVGANVQSADDFVTKSVKAGKAPEGLLPTQSDTFIKKASVKGSKAAQQLKETDKFIKGEVRRIHQADAFNNGFNESGQLIKNMMATFDDSLTNNVTRQLQGNSLALNIFNNTKQTYGSLMDDAGSFIGGFRQGAKTGKVNNKMATLANKLASNPGRNVMDKAAIREIKTALGPRNKQLMQAIDELEDMRAAAAQVPFTQNAILRYGLTFGIGGGVAGGNPTLIALASGALVATSPKLAGGVARGSVAATKSALSTLDAASKQVMVKNGLAGLSLLNGLRSSGQMESFIKDDKAIQQFLQTMGQIPNVEEQANQLLSPQGGQ